MPSIRKVYLAVLGTLLAGCTPLMQPEMKVPAPLGAMASRVPMTVAVSMASAAKAIDRFEDLPSPCNISFPKGPAPIGATFEKIVEQHLASVFERVMPYSKSGPAPIDAIFEINISVPGVRYGCAAWPTTYIAFSGDARIVEGAGREFWRARSREKRQEIPLTKDVRAYNTAIGARLSEAMSAMAQEWINEALSDGAFDAVNPKISRRPIGLLTPARFD